MASKADIRSEVRGALKELGAAQRQEAAAGIIAQLLAHPAVRSAGTVMLFSPLPSEPDISPLLNLLKDKTLLLPAVDGDDMLAKVASGEFRTGEFGITEPDTDSIFTDLDAIDVILVPGVAFTADGMRLGRGKGYYDRFLKKLSPRTLKIGIGYSLQLRASLPTDIWDMPLDLVVVA